MRKDKSAKGKNKSRKIQDLPAKGKRAAAVKGGQVAVQKSRLIEQEGIFYF